MVAAFLNLWSLHTNGYANEYYSAAVRSMSGSWHAFVYGSFDSVGVMTIDKSPLAFWVQSLSVRAFGLSSWSILVPQALMGVAAVALTYDLARRRFGRPAGFVAGLVLALTPVSVAIWRHNNPDALLILCCVAAAWFMVRGLESGRTRWLVLCGVAIGLGVETKMAAALLVVPALAAAWLWVAPRGVPAAVRSLLAGGAAMVVVGGAWPLFVALTPTSDRPWIGGTSDNSVWSLMLGYNGLGRLFGQAGGPGGRGAGGGAVGGQGGPFGGPTGPGRLLDHSLGGQAGWLLGFALVAGIGAAVATRLRRGDPRTGWVIAVGGSFATIAVAFSQAQGIFHPYYVSLLAPFTALLVGAGAALALSADRPARVLGSLALVAGVLCSVAILNDHPDQLTWLPVVLIGGGAAGAVLLATLDRGPARGVVLAGAIGLLLIAPAVWSDQTLGHPTNGTFPVGGPASGATFGGTGGPRNTAAARRRGGRRAGRAGGPMRRIQAALAYIDAHGGGTLAVSSQSGAAARIITRTGADVAGIGGFSGRESDVSVAWFADVVERGQIKWVLIGGPGRYGARDGRIGSGTVMWTVTQVGAKTPVRKLYDVSGRADALRAFGSGAAPANRA
jgi:4-amino-4-deoxy-L-arabinose transferase-like glycosyltransferase